jgi:hypothetical protein
METFSKMNCTFLSGLETYFGIFWRPGPLLWALSLGWLPHWVLQRLIHSPIGARALVGAVDSSGNKTDNRHHRALMLSKRKSVRSAHQRVSVVRGDVL